MTSLNFSLPEGLKAFVDQRVAGGDYATSGDYLRELIRRDQDRLHLHSLLLEGASSPATAAIDGAYFDELRDRVFQRRPA